MSNDDLSFLLSPEPLPKPGPEPVRSHQVASPERLKFIWAKARRSVVITRKSKPAAPTQAAPEAAPSAQPLTLKQQLEAWSK
jgi:hypothetical protein